MILDLVYKISVYLDNYHFIHLFIIKNELFEKRRKMINRINSSAALYYNLNKIFNMKHIDYECNYIDNLLKSKQIDLFYILDEMVDTFLRENKCRKLYKGYEMKEQLIYIKHSKKYILKKLYVSNVYRLSYFKTKELDKFKYAKALIY